MTFRGVFFFFFFGSNLSHFYFAIIEIIGGINVGDNISAWFKGEKSTH